MAKTTISGYSTELNQGPPGNPQTYAPIKPCKFYGKVRLSSFSLLLASQASTTSFAVMKIPKGATIISGVIIASATLANSATLAVGLAGADSTGFIDDNVALATVPTPVLLTTSAVAVSDSTTCLKAAAVQSTTAVGFALTQALGYLYETAKDCYLTLTTGVGTVSTETVTGHVFYSVE